MHSVVLQCVMLFFPGHAMLTETATTNMPEMLTKHTDILKSFITSSFTFDIKTKKDMALSAISMNSALADKEFVLSLHHKLHVSTCINKPNDVHKHN